MLIYKTVVATTCVWGRGWTRILFECPVQCVVAFSLLSRFQSSTILFCFVLFCVNAYLIWSVFYSLPQFQMNKPFPCLHKHICQILSDRLPWCAYTSICYGWWAIGWAVPIEQETLYALTYVRTLLAERLSTLKYMDIIPTTFFILLPFEFETATYSSRVDRKVHSTWLASCEGSLSIQVFSFFIQREGERERERETHWAQIYAQRMAYKILSVYLAV